VFLSASLNRIYSWKPYGKRRRYRMTADIET
jgi:hypothetical protein